MHDGVMGVAARLTQLNVLLGEFSGLPDVPIFARAGVLSDKGIAFEINTLEEAAEQMYGVANQLGAETPVDVPRMAGILPIHHVPPELAVDILASLLAINLVFSEPYADRNKAKSAAEQIALLLGEGTCWWSNLSRDPAEDSCSWFPITGFTFDGVVAAVAPNRTFVAVLQVGED